MPGNHDIKLLRKLGGRDVQITHGLADTLEQLKKEPPEFRKQVLNFSTISSATTSWTVEI